MDTHTYTHTYTHDNYYNPRCAHAHRGLMKALKCKPSAQFAYNYSINVLSKCSNIISHRSSVFEGQCLDLQRSAHRSPKVDTSIFESRHIDLRRSTHRSSTHRSSKVNTSIFQGQHTEGGNITPTIRHRILSTTALHSIIP